MTVTIHFNQRLLIHEGFLIEITDDTRDAVARDWSIMLAWDEYYRSQHPFLKKGVTVTMTTGDRDGKWDDDIAFAEIEDHRTSYYEVHDNG